jgi:putative ABC transport system permease protein
MTSLLRDLRFALRMLRKSPGVTAVMLLALVLGLGVSTSVFGAVNVMLLRPLYVKDPQQLAYVFDGPADLPRVWGTSSYPDYADFARENSVFSGLLATQFDSLTISSGDAHEPGNAERAEFIFGEWVTGNYFDVLGVHPILGRTFAPEETAISSSQTVVVISHELWQSRFHSEPSVIGRRVYLNTTPYTIIGVMPPQFHLFRAQLGFWVPLGSRIPFGFGEGWLTDRTQRDLVVLGRLQPGATLAQADARLNVVAQGLAAQYPSSNANTKVAVTTEVEGRYREGYEAVRLSCTIALLVAGLVLLVSCASVANLLLARTAARSRELAIRVALGASRARIARQLLTESLLLSFVGGALGLLLAFWFGDLLRALLPPRPFQLSLDIEPDARTFAAVAACSVFAGVVSGALPAWRASRADVMTALKTDTGAQGQTMRRAGLRQLLVVTQLAISIVVVVSGGLLLRSLHRLGSLDPGIRTESLVSGLVDPGSLDYNDAQVEQYFRELTARLEGLPGVRSASTVRWMPLLNMQGGAGPVVKEGDPTPLPNQWKPVLYTIVYSKYFETIGTDILVGRDFEAREHEGKATTLIVNAELARRLFGSEREAIGKRLRVGGEDDPWLEVVGVARDGRYTNLFEDPKPFLYFPAPLPSLRPDYMTGRTVLVRAASQFDTARAMEGLRAEVTKLDARIPIVGPAIASHHLDPAMEDSRIAADLGMILGVIALGLATMGLYSVMTYGVIQRTKEIGIRMALGARARDVLGLVVGQGLALVAIGIVVGGAGALAIGRLLVRFLYGVSPADPVTYAVTIVLLGCAAFVATLIPARRATRVDPMVSLRYE